MFFDYSLLNRRNGKFSLIWLIVNDRLEYRRRTDKHFREVLAVNVPRTCEDIIRYICAQMPAHAGGARPRFSLYLSSMLMAGCVRVYHHQTCILLSDAANAFERLMKTSYIGGCLEDDPVNVRRVTLMVDPLSLVPSGDPFQLGSLYDIDTMLQLGVPEEPPQEQEGDLPAAATAGRQPRQQEPPPYNPNLARVSDITLREEDRSERQQHVLEDFGEPLLPHQRPVDPFLELELELAPGRHTEPAAGVHSPRASGAGDGVPLLGDLEGEAPPPPPPPTGEEPPPPPPAAEEQPPPPPEETTLPATAAPAATIQAEIEATPQRAGDGTVPQAGRPSRRRAPPAADVTIEEPPPPPPPPPPQQQPRRSADEERPSDSLQLPEMPPPAPPVRHGRRRRLAVDSAIELDREAIRRRMDEGAYDTLRAATATEDNVEAPSARLTPAAELLLRPGRRVGGPLARLHQRHCVTRPERDWSWHVDEAQEPAVAERRRERTVEPEPPQPEAQRDRTGTMSGSGSLLSASDLPSARSSVGQQLSFRAGATPSTSENLPSITEDQEQTPGGRLSTLAPVVEHLVPLMEQLVPPPEEQQMVHPPIEEQQLVHPPIEEQQVVQPPMEEQQAPSMEQQVPPMEQQVPPMEQQFIPPPMEEQQIPPMEHQQFVPPTMEQQQAPPMEQQQIVPPPMEEQLMPPPPPRDQRRPSPEERRGPTAAPAPADVGAGDRSGSSGRTTSSEEAPPTQSPPMYYGSASQFRSASLVPEDVPNWLSRWAPAGPLSFSQLAPPSTTSAQQAAATFAHLLQLHAERAVVLSQDEPYGEITVRALL
ncbi:fibrous sheath CABYR-binding protein-like [Amphibalanus amphitrite]|uniref:fibrous sheath CABYR-binding protein-like n=1 Tax=Amphibalanus amphitrite TaxID=1232801 RepID=UPI001C917208|nr:fibrous sheath CABYR-binding protein-like [Amphibalanus amphitrite]